MPTEYRILNCIPHTTYWILNTAYWILNAIGVCTNEPNFKLVQQALTPYAANVYSDMPKKCAEKTNPISPGQKRGLVRSAARQVVPVPAFKTTKN